MVRWGVVVLAAAAAGCSAPVASGHGTGPAGRPPAGTAQPAPPGGGGLSFSRPVDVTGGPGFAAVSCGTTTSCAAVDASGRIFSFDGRAWAAPVAPAGQSMGPGTPAVSCWAAAACAAIPTGGDVVAVGGGGSWAVSTLVGATGLGAVGCAPGGYCAAVDAEGNAFASTGQGWYRTSGDWGASSGISCVSSSFCVSVSGGLSLWDGSRWSQPTRDQSTSSFTAVTCPSATFCVAANRTGDVLVWNGQSWSAPLPIESPPSSATTIGPYVTGLSCPTTTFCVAVDSAGDVLQWHGGAWRTVPSDPGRALTGVSCPDPSLCVAVDAAGRALVGRTG